MLFSTKELVKRLIFSIFILYHKYEKMEKTALDRYEEIVTDALRCNLSFASDFSLSGSNRELVKGQFHCSDLFVV